MRRGAALALGVLLATALLPTAVASPQDAPEDQPPVVAPQVRIESVDLDDHPEVELTVSVSAPTTSPLSADAFTLVEDGKALPAAVTYAETTDLQVVLLIDTTGSMGGPPMEDAKAAATTFVTELPDAVNLAVVGYDATTTVVTGFGSTREEHLAGIASLTPDGTTAMYDAVVTAIELFPDADASRAIVLLTDGEDNASTSTVEEATAALLDAEATLHSVEYLTAYTEGQGIRAMATATGGAVFRADDAATLDAIYQQLAADLAGRYRIAYSSDASGRVELELTVEHEGRQATGQRIVVLPTPPDAVAPEEPAPIDDEAAGDDASAVTAPPTIPPSEAGLLGRSTLVVGAVLWFLALVLATLVVLRPRERRAQLAGAAPRTHGHGSGLTALADRASHLAERSLEARGYRSRLDAALEQAGIALRPGEFLVLVGCATITAGVLGMLVQGGITALVFAILTLLAARLVVSVRRSRRQARFADQLGETLQLLTGSLRAGYSLLQAVDAVAREATSPASDEFSRLVVETRLGRDMTESLTAMADRMGSVDFHWVVQAIGIHREVGGDLAEVLDTVATTIRERDHVRRQVRSLSAEGRISAYVLIALPFVAGLGLYLVNPSYIGELIYGGLLGWGLIGLCLALMAIGALWMRRLVRLVF